jgi:hypothetical protein
LVFWLWIIAGLLALVVADGLVGRYTWSGVSHLSFASARSLESAATQLRR